MRARRGLTHSKEDSAGPLTAPRPRPAVAEDPSLLRHEVVLEGFNQQVLALRVVPHQQLRVHVAHEEVPAQQRQPHALHELRGEELRPIGRVGRVPPSAAHTSPLQTPGPWQGWLHLDMASCSLGRTGTR